MQNQEQKQEATKRIFEAYEYFLASKESVNVEIPPHVKIIKELKLLQDKGALSDELNIKNPTLFKNSDILICATGNKSLTDVDLQYIKPGCYISSCTSKDDEFAFGGLDLSKLKETGTRIKSFHDKYFINDGNAVNFAYPEKCNQMLAPYIYLTLSALIASAIKLDKKEINPSQKINVLCSEEEKKLISGFLQSIKTNNDRQQFITKVKRTELWKGL